jgi:dCTP diphosphatase
MASPAFEPTLTLERLRGAMAGFVAERDWEQFHTPRNVLLALVGEVGEVAELFQWRGEVARGLGASWTAADREHLGEELSDVLLYLVRLADLCAVDLSTAALGKMRKNAEKYPADRCKGRSDKYTAYADGASSPNAVLRASAAAAGRAAHAADAAAVGAGSSFGAAAAAAAINAAATPAPAPASATAPAPAPESAPESAPATSTSTSAGGESTAKLALAAAGGAALALALAAVATLALGRRAAR